MICRVFEKAWVISQAHDVLGCGKLKKWRITTLIFIYFFGLLFLVFFNGLFCCFLEILNAFS